MALGDVKSIAGVCLAGDSHLTWVASDVATEPDSPVVVEIDGLRHIGRVRVQPGGIVTGMVEPAGRIIAQANTQDLYVPPPRQRPPDAPAPDARLGGIGRLSPSSGEPDLSPLLQEFHSTLPRLGDRVRIDRGDGEVIRLRVSEDRMTVRLDSGEEIDLARDAADRIADTGSSQ